MLRDSLKVTKLDHGPAETQTWTRQLLTHSSERKATRTDGLPDTRKLTPRPSSGSAGPPPAASVPPGGARGGLAVAPRPSLWCLGSGGSRGALLGGGGAAPGAGPRGGRERPGRPAGDGWGGNFLRQSVRMSRPPPGAPQPQRRRRG